MEYQKSSSGISGDWVKGENLKTGTKAKLMTPAERRESMFKDDKGNVKMQDVAKIRFQGDETTYNIALNRGTIDALIDAYGNRSEDWVGKVLTVHIEPMNVGGRRVRAVYLLPEGFQVGEDENGYIVVQRKPFVATDEPAIEYPAEEVRPEDIPF
jgi:hypothetical protein